MNRLAQLLLEERVLDRRQLEDVLEGQAVYGGSFETNLLELGHLDERRLQPYLERAVGIKNRIDPFREAETKARALLKRDQVQKYRMVPFRLERRQLDVLLCDPTDVASVDEVSFITGCRLQVNITTEVRLAYHLHVNYQLGLPHRLQQILMNKISPRPRAAFDPDARSRAAAPAAPADAADAADAGAGPEERGSVSIAITLDDTPIPPVDAPVAPAPPRASSQPITARHTRPSMTGMPRPSRPSLTDIRPTQKPAETRPANFIAPPIEDDEFGGFEPVPLVPPVRPSMEMPAPKPNELLAAQLAKVSDRDEIPPIVLGSLSTMLPRAYLFSVRNDRLIGWDAQGKRVKKENVTALSLPLGRPSVFKTVMADGKAFAGALPQDEVEESLVIKLGCDEWPEHVLIVPIRVKERCVAVLYAEANDLKSLEAAREPAGTLGALTSEAFVRLILAKKQK